VTSPASIERDRSSATTSASFERNTGTGSRSHVGPATATQPSVQASSAATTGQRLSRSAFGAASTYGRSAASTTAVQLPPRSRRAKNSQTMTSPTGNAASQSGLKKCSSATRPAPCEQARRKRRGRDDDGGTERPLEELVDGSEAFLFLLRRLE